MAGVKSFLEYKHQPSSLPNGKRRGGMKCFLSSVSSMSRICTDKNMSTIVTISNNNTKRKEVIYIYISSITTRRRSNASDHSTHLFHQRVREHSLDTQMLSQRGKVTINSSEKFRTFQKKKKKKNLLSSRPKRELYSPKHLS